MLGLLRNRCLWRGGGGGTLFSKPTKTHANNNLSSTLNHRYAFSFLQVFHIGDYFTSKRLYVSEDETSKESEGPEMNNKITKGHVIDLHNLLFTKNRDYLIRYQDNQQVKAQHLKDKVILICFTSILSTHNLRYYATLLENLHNHLYPLNGFEVVFVTVKNDVDENHEPYSDHYKNYKKIEEEIFSIRPWTAIPFSDMPSENSLQTRGFPEISHDIPTVLIVDSTGMVLQCHDAYYILELYGALGYPFSDERIKDLQSEDDAIAMQPSLQTLLASPQRDYVISNKGEKIPIQTLEDKVVGLYFYDEDAEIDDSDLKRAYIELKKNNENFEIVLIYTPESSAFCSTTEESFRKRFNTMPWLALPLNDPNVIKLKRILEYYLKYIDYYQYDQFQVTRLVIFGPHGKFIEPFGGNILRQFGVKAYPFTFAKLVKLEMEKVSDMKLEMLWDRNTVFRRKDGSEVPVSQLAGKNVMVFLDMHGLGTHKIEFLKMLKERYVQCKGTHDEFEVIQISGKEEEVSKHVGYLPWVVSELSPVVDRDFFRVHNHFSSSFVFFNGDGRVVRNTMWPSFENKDFPFCADGLEKEAWVQLSVWFDWQHWYGSCIPCLGRRRIYSLEKMNAPANLRVREF